MNEIEGKTSLEVFETSLKEKHTLLPEKSERRYLEAYNMFKEWRKDKNITSYSEDVFMDYVNFLQTQKKYAPSSLWGQYSMLVKTLNLNDNVDISRYTKLKSVLKKINVGYIPKKSKILTDSDIATFISAAPDSIHLLNKVVLVLGISGELLTQELHDIKVGDVLVKGNDTALVTIPATTTKTGKSFAIVGHFFELYAKYAQLRPKKTKLPNLFLKYERSKCIQQPVGINKIAKIPQVIAKFLNLPNPELYTGSSFRRSGVSLTHNLRTGVDTSKRVGGWYSDNVATQEENFHQNKLIILIGNERLNNTGDPHPVPFPTNSFNCRNIHEIADDEMESISFHEEDNGEPDMSFIKEEVEEEINEIKGETLSSFSPIEESQDFSSTDFETAEHMTEKLRLLQPETNKTIDPADDTMCSEKSRKYRRAEERHKAKMNFLKERHKLKIRLMKERHEADMEIRRLKVLKLRNQLAAKT